MVYLLNMVIFHGYVSHNQMVSVTPTWSKDFPGEWGVTFAAIAHQAKEKLHPGEMDGDGLRLPGGLKKWFQVSKLQTCFVLSLETE